MTHDINIEEVAMFMHRQWKMKAPRIVVMMISNVSPLREWTNTRQMANFQKGLIKVFDELVYHFFNSLKMFLNSFCCQGINFLMQMTKITNKYYCLRLNISLSLRIIVFIIICFVGSQVNKHVDFHKWH